MKARIADKGGDFVVISSAGAIETKRTAHEGVALQEFFRAPGNTAKRLRVRLKTLHPDA